MITPDAAPELPDLDFWNERPTRSRTHRRRASGSRRVGRVRTLAALVLVGGLAVAWGTTAQHPHPRAHAVASRPRDVARTTTASVTRSSVTRSSGGGRNERALLAAVLPADAICGTGSASAAATTCSVARVPVEYRLVRGDALRSEYLAAVLPGFAGGNVALAAGAGAPACARGAEDERGWSRPAAPLRTVGRYACRIEQGRAAMWWTVDDRGLLAHATAPDTDLTSLFEWWESHSER